MAINVKETAEIREHLQRAITGVIKTAKTLEDLGVDTTLRENGKTENISAFLHNLSEKVGREAFKILVIGEFKNGKSTFINAMLGEKVLPEDALPCTAVISEVVYGRKGVTMYFQNPLPENISGHISDKVKAHISANRSLFGGGVPELEMTFSELWGCVTIPEKELTGSEDDGRDDNERGAEVLGKMPYDHAVIRYPLAILKDGVEIIDTPGLNENQAREEITMNYLKNADAIIFMFSFPKILSIQEQATINTLSAFNKYIFFVVNKMDQAIKDSNRTKIISYAHSKLDSQTELGRDGVFFVSALNALETGNDVGMTEFESALSEYLSRYKARAKFGSVSDKLLSMIDGLLRTARELITKLENDLSANEQTISENMEALKAAQGKKAEALRIHTEKVRKERESIKKRVNEAKASLRAAENQKVQIISRVDSARDELYATIQSAMSKNITRYLAEFRISSEASRLDILSLQQAHFSAR